MFLFEPDLDFVDIITDEIKYRSLHFFFKGKVDEILGKIGSLSKMGKTFRIGYMTYVFSSVPSIIMLNCTYITILCVSFFKIT